MTAPRYLFSGICLLERIGALGQGKGYGAGTIKQEVRLLQHLLGRAPRLAIDIGGNVGNYTAELRRRNPSLEIHTFEPSATNISKLRDRFKLDTAVTLLPFAVSDSSGSATLFSDQPGSHLSSLSKRQLDHFNISFEAQEMISTIRFEDYWKTELGERQLDIVKIDIEGHELAALNGFGSAIDATSVIQFEFGGCNIDTRTYFRDFWYFFQPRGFDLYRITPFGAERMRRYKESDEFFSTTNYVAVNRAHDRSAPSV
jgi:FkbM family methyltransferase